MEKLTKREQAALKIIHDPHGYRVCLICESIVVRDKSAFCANCQGYRFSENVEEIVAQARKLAGKQQTTVTREDLLG